MLHFLFDGGVISSGAVVTVAIDEIAEYRFASPHDALTLVGLGLGQRLQHALGQDAGGVYLDKGTIPSSRLSGSPPRRLGQAAMIMIRLSRWRIPVRATRRAVSGALWVVAALYSSRRTASRGRFQLVR